MGDVVNVLCASMSASAVIVIVIIIIFFFSSSSMVIYNVVDDEPAPEGGRGGVCAGAPGDGAGVGRDGRGRDGRGRGGSARGEAGEDARIKDELGVTLLYPTYREGLTAMAEWGTGPRFRSEPISRARRLQSISEL